MAKARPYVRFRIAFYCSTRAYWDVLRLHDLEWLGEKLNPFPRENRWSEMAEQIPDDKIDLFATVADYASLRRAIEARYGGYADTVSLQISADEDFEDSASACGRSRRFRPASSHTGRLGTSGAPRLKDGRSHAASHQRVVRDAEYVG